MSYLRSLFFNFLIVYLVDRVTPGLSIESFEQLPNVGADLLFSIIVGFLNASVYFFFSILEIEVTKFKLALFTFIISYLAYLSIFLVPFGVRAETVWGFLIAGTVVWAVAYLTNLYAKDHSS